MNIQEQEYSWIAIDGLEGIYFIEGFENSSNIYYISEGSMLVDTGNDYTAFLEFSKVADISDISTVFLTHSHNDHTLGLFDLLRSYEEFDSITVFVHASMSDALEKRLRVFGKDVRVLGLRGGEELEIGGEKYRVLDTPGHTFDHLSLYNHDSGVLFSGDAVITNPVYDQNLGGSLKYFALTLRHLRSLSVSYILPGHGYYACGNVTGMILEKAYFNAIRDMAPEGNLKDCAKAALKLGLVDEAEYALKAYLELDDSEDREALFGIASIRADRGDAESVEKMLADHIRNGDENAIYIAGMASMKSGRFEKAIDYFRELSELTGKSEYKVLYGSALYESGRVAEAMGIKEFRMVYRKVGQNR